MADSTSLCSEPPSEHSTAVASKPRACFAVMLVRGPRHEGPRHEVLRRTTRLLPHVVCTVMHALRQLLGHAVAPCELRHVAQPLAKVTATQLASVAASCAGDINTHALVFAVKAMQRDANVAKHDALQYAGDELQRYGKAALHVCDGRDVAKAYGDHGC